MHEASFVAVPGRPSPRRPRWGLIGIVLALGLLVLLAVLIGLQTYVTARSFEISRSLAAAQEVTRSSELAAWATSIREWQTSSYRISLLAANVVMALLVAAGGLALV